MNEPKHTTNYTGPVTLIVMDGFGLSDNTVGNAIKAANAPLLNRLMSDYPMQRLKASGTAVGLPSDEDVGNSEVGHNAMGAGRVYAQGARLVGEALDSGAVFKGEVWQRLVQNAKSGHTLHFVGLLSDANVHSNIRHLFAMLDEAHREGVEAVRIHAILDGRDVAPTSALEYIDQLESKLASLGSDYKIASGGGRMQITMDRYGADWGMVERGWRTQVMGEGRQFATARETVETLRRENSGITDQNLPPFVIAVDGEPIGRIASDDSVILFNFRGDRAIEAAEVFEAGADFDKFDRGDLHVEFAGLLEYDSEQHIPKSFLVSPPEFKNTLGEFLADHGVRQLALSETQKIGHVTYFFNGNRAAKFKPGLEDYVEVPSIPADQVPFDQQPAMQSAAISERFVELTREKDYQFVRMNYPNPDMVGHTGDYEATVKAIEAVDVALAPVLDAIDREGGMAIIVGDHGNAEEMFELNADGTAKLGEDGKPLPKTAHTSARVPCIFYDNTDNRERYQVLPGDDFGLTNLASTIALLLDLQPLAEWDKPIIELR
jgi:2,3-bisphosphoglycerate-independent phosphoglycerate mutase